jgi:hypothetical protein
VIVGHADRVCRGGGGEGKREMRSKASRRLLSPSPREICSNGKRNRKLIGNGIPPNSR